MDEVSFGLGMVVTSLLYLCVGIGWNFTADDTLSTVYLFGVPFAVLSLVAGLCIIAIGLSNKDTRDKSPLPFSISTWIPGREVDMKSEGDERK